MIFYIALTYIAACFYLGARGGAYRFSGPDDTGQATSRWVYSPMVELRLRGYPYIRDQIFFGLFAMPIVYAAHILYQGMSWYALPAFVIGWTWGGIRGWGKTLLQMTDIKNFVPSFIRILQFAGLYFLPWAVEHNLADIWKPFLCTITVAAIVPLVYHVYYNLTPGDRDTNYAEITTGAILGLTSFFIT